MHFIKHNYGKCIFTNLYSLKQGKSALNKKYSDIKYSLNSFIFQVISIGDRVKNSVKKTNDLKFFIGKFSKFLF